MNYEFTGASSGDLDDRNNYSPVGTPAPGDQVTFTGTRGIYSGTLYGDVVAWDANVVIWGGTFLGAFSPLSSSNGGYIAINGGTFGGPAQFDLDSYTVGLDGVTFNSDVVFNGLPGQYNVVIEGPVVFNARVSFDGGSTWCYAASQSTDPGVSNVKSGTTYEINAVPLTGNYSGGGGGTTILSTGSFGSNAVGSFTDED